MIEDPPIPHGLPTEREHRYDPAPQLAKLRDRRPISPMVYADGHEGWLVTSHELVRRVLGDARFSSDPTRLHSPIPIPSNSDKPDDKPMRIPPARPGFFIRMDPPEHTRLRRMLTGVFTVRRMQAVEPRVAQIVAGQLDELEKAGPGSDLVSHFALPVPSLVICELLGVPYAERDRFQRDSARLLRLDLPLEERMAAMENIDRYLLELVHAKRDQPGDDLLSDLIERGELSDAELSGMGFLLLVAGHETTANMIGLGTMALLENPEQLARLAAEPELIDGAVEELLRYLSIIHIGPIRTAIEDVELGGRVVKAGDCVTVSVSSANRDPRKFPDPDVLDVGRHAAGHVAFGHGLHQCLGQQLARIELRIGLAALLERLPGLRLAVPAEKVRMREQMGIYGVHELPVTW